MGRRLFVERPLKRTTGATSITESSAQIFPFPRNLNAIQDSLLDDGLLDWQGRVQLGFSQVPLNYLPCFLQRSTGDLSFSKARLNPTRLWQDADNLKAPGAAASSALFRTSILPKLSRILHERSSTGFTNEFQVDGLTHICIDESRLSRPRNSTERSKTLGMDTIIKDVRRTFQGEKYFRNPPVLGIVQSLLETASERHAEIGYVQGMNFVSGAIIFHCPHERSAAKIWDFLFENLELRKVFNFTSLESFVNLAKSLLKFHLLEFFFFFDQVVKTDFRILLLDWFFCLAFSKVPLAESGTVLHLIIRHGWYFFYRLLLCYFRAFEAKYAHRLLGFRSPQARFELEVELKNFFKTKLDWKGLIAQAMEFPLLDSLLDEQLGWAKRGLFMRVGAKGTDKL
jgi:hypothetical protein